MSYLSYRLSEPDINSYSRFFEDGDDSLSGEIYDEEVSIIIYKCSLKSDF